jgi:hypothetical protein
VKRGLFVMPAVGLVFMLSAVTAAAAEWCSDDPAIRFVDASGHLRTVYLTTYGDGLEHSQQVSAQVYTYTVKYSDNGHKTKLKLKVYVPDDGRHHFHVRSTVSTGPGGTGVVLGHHDADSGHASDLDFEVAS